jgi:hypothetical protein
VIFSNATATTGKTPFEQLGGLAKGLPSRVVGEPEMRNPCGGVKTSRRKLKPAEPSCRLRTHGPVGFDDMRERQF